MHAPRSSRSTRAPLPLCVQEDRDRKQKEYLERKAAKQAEWDAWKKLQEEEEAKRDPWEEEKALCEQLIGWTEKKMPKKEEVVAEVKIDHLDGKTPLKKANLDDEDPFAGLGAPRPPRPPRPPLPPPRPPLTPASALPACGVPCAPSPLLTAHCGVARCRQEEGQEQEEGRADGDGRDRQVDEAEALLRGHGPVEEARHRGAQGDERDAHHHGGAPRQEGVAQDGAVRRRRLSRAPPPRDPHALAAAVAPLPALPLRAAGIPGRPLPVLTPSIAATPAGPSPRR